MRVVAHRRAGRVDRDERSEQLRPLRNAPGVSRAAQPVLAPPHLETAASAAGGFGGGRLRHVLAWRSFASCRFDARSEHRSSLCRRDLGRGPWCVFGACSAVRRLRRLRQEEPSQANGERASQHDSHPPDPRSRPLFDRRRGCAHMRRNRHGLPSSSREIIHRKTRGMGLLPERETAQAPRRAHRAANPLAGTIPTSAPVLPSSKGRGGAHRLAAARWTNCPTTRAMPGRAGAASPQGLLAGENSHSGYPEA